MKLIFYIFLISQFFSLIRVFAEKIKEFSSESSSVKWEKVEGKSSSNLEAIIIWEPYKYDEIFPIKNSNDDTNNKKVDIKIVGDKPKNLSNNSKLNLLL